MLLPIGTSCETPLRMLLTGSPKRRLGSEPILYDHLIAPFVEFAFMRRALVGAFGARRSVPRPVGVFLMLRRMSLVGDAMAHAILPGAAHRLFAVGPLAVRHDGGRTRSAGFVIALGAGAVARVTELKEDASLAAFFLISLAVGVTIVSLKGNNVDLLHFLFGSVLALDDPTLLLIAGITTISLATLAVHLPPAGAGMRRSRLPALGQPRGRARRTSRSSRWSCMNLVGGFHALGTLLAVGIMMLPAVIAPILGARHHGLMIGVAVVSGVISGYAGLLLSFHTGTPAGPAIILVGGRAVRCLGAVRPGRRPGAPALPRTPSRSLKELRTMPTSCACGFRRRVGAVMPAAAAGEAQGRRDVLDPCRLREKRRWRPGRRVGAGRAERRRACLSADAERREDARRRQGRAAQRVRLRGLDQSPREGFRHQGRDGDRHARA